MQNRDQIEKEIEAVKLQLDFAEISALTAPAEEKDRWEQRKSNLQGRLTALEEQLLDCVVYDADSNGVPVSDASASAEVPLGDSPVSSPAEEMTEQMADAMLDRILHTTEADIPADADAMRILYADVPPENPAGQSTTDKMANAMVDNILLTQDAPAAQPIDDAAADAMLNAILSATEPMGTDMPGADAVAEPTPEEMLRRILETPDEPTPEESVSAPHATEIVFEQPPEEKPAAQQSVAQQPVAAPPQPATPFADDFAARLQAVQSTEGADANTVLTIEKLKLEAEDAFRRADAALREAERMKKEAAEIKLAAETERAMFAAEMELQRGVKSREAAQRESEATAARDRIAEKIARRKAEITEIRNGLQDVKDSDSAFALREKLFSVQLVLDDDERNSPEISYLLTKSMDDITHAVEVADLKRRISALVAAKKAPAKKAAPTKKKPKKAKKKRPVMMAGRRRPPMGAYGRRRPSRYAPYPPRR